MTKRILSYDRLKGLFRYNAATGIITNAVDRVKAKVGTEAGYDVSHGYRQIEIDKKIYPYHHVAWALVYGEWPEDQLDHINHDRSDNRIANLRQVTNAGNRLNLSMRKDNTTGHTCIYKAYGDKYIVRVTKNKVTRNLGTYEDIDAAIQARDRGHKDLGFHPNHGR